MNLGKSKGTAVQNSEKRPFNFSRFFFMYCLQEFLKISFRFQNLLYFFLMLPLQKNISSLPLRLSTGGIDLCERVEMATGCVKRDPLHLLVSKPIVWCEFVGSILSLKFWVFT